MWAAMDRFAKGASRAEGLISVEDQRSLMLSPLSRRPSFLRLHGGIPNRWDSRGHQFLNRYPSSWYDLVLVACVLTVVASENPLGSLLTTRWKRCRMFVGDGCPGSVSSDFVGRRCPAVRRWWES